MRTIGRVVTTPGRLAKRAWTALRRRGTPGSKLSPKERTEVKKFKYIGWVGLGPGIIGTGVTLGATAMGLGPLAPVIGLGASSVAAAINAPIQGYISALLTRKLDRGTMGETIDRSQNRQIKRLQAAVDALTEQNAKLDKKLNELSRRVGEQPKGRGSARGGTSRSGKSAKQGTTRQSGREAGTGAKAGESRTSTGKSERPTAAKPPKREPRSR